DPGVPRRSVTHHSGAAHARAEPSPAEPPPADRRPRCCRGVEMRVSLSILVIVGSLAVLVAVIVTNQVLPADDPGVARLRPWLAARALGVTAYLLLALDVGVGLVLA